MDLHNIIGIDPDAMGFECALVDAKNSTQKVIRKHFYVSSEHLAEFVAWTKSINNVVVAIEGIGGQSAPIEKALRIAGIDFYSFKPIDVTKARELLIGENKDNANDAESTARLVIQFNVNDMLEKHKQIHLIDDGLRDLTRVYQSFVSKRTSYINLLWKELRKASADLYLFLCGAHLDATKKDSILGNIAILLLFINASDIGKWHTMSDEEMLKTMGGRKYKSVMQHITHLKNVSSKCNEIPFSLVLSIQSLANIIMQHNLQIKAIQNQLIQVAKKNPYITKLASFKGIGIVSAAIIVAETITISRFKTNDNLASYCGLGRKSSSSGNESEGKKSRPSTKYNRRLKNVFLTIARTYVQFNAKEHLSMYYKNLVKKGMKPLEARKRVARGLVRNFFKELKSIESGI